MTVTYIWKVLITVVIFFAAIVWLDQNLGELWNIVFFQCYDYLFLAAAKTLFLFLQSEVVARIVFPIFPSEMTFGRLPLALNHMHMGHLGLEEMISYRKAVKLGYYLPEICENTYILACIWLSVIPMSLSNTALYFTNSDLNSFHSTGSHSFPLHPAVASLGYTLPRECYCGLICQHRRKLLVVLVYLKIWEELFYKFIGEMWNKMWLL